MVGSLQKIMYAIDVMKYVKLVTTLILVKLVMKDSKLMTMDTVKSNVNKVSTSIK